MPRAAGFAAHPGHPSTAAVLLQCESVSSQQPASRRAPSLHWHFRPPARLTKSLVSRQLNMMQTPAQPARWSEHLLLPNPVSPNRTPYVSPAGHTTSLPSCRRAS
ncbi:hypothetical protein ACN47E_007834 [Coniothyrium glycines]